MLKEFGYAIRTDNITSFPNNINSNGDSIIDYSISGDMIQKSENLWNENYTGISTTIKYVPIYVGDGVFTMSSTTPISTGSAATLFFLSGNVSSGASTATNSVYLNNPKTISSIDGYVTVAFRTYTTDTPVGQQTMLNKGLTALPYVSYNPTPTYPITPIECGDKTDNLLKLSDANFTINTLTCKSKNNVITLSGNVNYEIYPSNNDWKNLDFYLDAGTYYLNKPSQLKVNYGRYLYFYDTSEKILDSADTTFTLTERTHLYIGFYIYGYNLNDDLLFMINEGSTALPYEPYGYKINIQVNNTDNIIYTSEPIRKIGNYSDTIEADGTVTRIIKKLVLIGDETTWRITGSGRYAVRVGVAIPDNASCICTHFKGTDVTAFNLIGDGECSAQLSGAGGYREIGFYSDTYTTLEAFQNFITHQYAAVTPVTVWYVLATLTTDTTITTPPTINTIKGINTINNNNILSPSNIRLKYNKGDWLETYYKQLEIVEGAKQWVNKVPKIYINNKWTYDWTTFRELVRSGKAQDVFPVGTILYDTWGDNTSTAFQIVSYNTHYNTDLYNEGYTNSVTLCEEKVRYGVPFDSVEAMMYVTTAMPAGGYKFTLPNYDTSYGGNKTYYFETTQEVPVGGQICLEWRYQTVPRTIRTYASNTSTTVLDSYGTSSSPLPEWDSTAYPDAIDLGTVTLSTTATTSTYGIFNHIHRARYGSNNYLQSRIRQYMNGTTNWWTPQTIFDRPTDWNITTLPTNGLLNILNTDLTNILTTPTITTTANNTFEYQSLDGTTFTLNSSYTINTDKLFLLSHTEVNLSATPNSGTVLDYYINADNAKRIKYDITASSTARYWWFRTPSPSITYTTRSCYSTGALSLSTAYYGYGCVPACVIQ